MLEEQRNSLVATDDRLSANTLSINTLSINALSVNALSTNALSINTLSINTEPILVRTSEPSRCIDLRMENFDQDAQEIL